MRPRSDIGPRSSRRPALTSAVVAGGFAIGLTVFRTANETGQGPGMSPGAILGFVVAFGGPAIVGAIGAWTGRREPVIAAGLALLPMAVLSVIALPLVVPAGVLVAAGLGMSGPETTGGRRGRAVVAGVRVGLLVVLLLGAIVGLFATTQAVCWDRFADGRLETRPAEAPGAVVEIPVGGLASGCDGGVISSTGVAISIVGVAAAAAVAVSMGRGPQRRGA